MPGFALPERRPRRRGKRRRTWLTLALLAAVTGCGAAAAATLTLGAGGIGAASAAIARCDSNGFTLSYAISAGNVTSVTVGGIADPACEGATLRLQLARATGTALGSAGPFTVPTDGDTADNSVVLAIAAQPDAGLVKRAHIALEGP